MATPLITSLAIVAARVLVTPPATTGSVTPTRVIAPPSSPAQEVLDDEPCSTLVADTETLPACSCYSWLPHACTRLLRDETSEDTPVFRCGAQVDFRVIPPDSCQGGYYGHDSSLSPESVLQHGLQARGDDWDLIRHVEQTGRSAFRGTTKFVTYPGGGGAAAWADEGGYVYEVTCVPSWDVNKHLQGRRLVSDLAVGTARFGDNLVLGEQEHVIPSRVPPEHIKRYGAVVSSVSGVPFVPRNAWVDNPRWQPCFCRYSLSECDDSVPCD